jgi:hypothetical protein
MQHCGEAYFTSFNSIHSVRVLVVHVLCQLLSYPPPAPLICHPTLYNLDVKIVYRCVCSALNHARTQWTSIVSIVV